MSADQGQPEGITLIAVDFHPAAMLTCPYCQRCDGGRCVAGSWEEPAGRW